MIKNILLNLYGFCPYYLRTSTLIKGNTHHLLRTQTPPKLNHAQYFFTDISTICNQCLSFQFFNLIHIRFHIYFCVTQYTQTMQKPHNSYHFYCHRLCFLDATKTLYSWILILAKFTANFNNSSLNIRKSMLA